MKKIIKDNENYSAYVVEIQNHIQLEGCDNICGTMIFNSHVIISKDTPLKTMGLYFPPECQLSEDFVKNNNLYRDPTLNKDINKSGFIEVNRRIKAMRLRGFKSDGLFVPINCLSYLNIDLNDFEIGEKFDTIDNNEICKKYLIIKNIPGIGNSQKQSQKLKRFSKLIDNQVRLHIDTSHLDRNIHKINYDTLISITNKLHGCAGMSSYVLCRKYLFFNNIFHKLRNWAIK